MDKRVLWLCLAAGSALGGLLPEAWGASAFGVASLLGSVAGGVAGVWVAVRISGSI
jgi:outer membrane lipoprotein SlyB